MMNSTTPPGAGLPVALLAGALSTLLSLASCSPAAPPEEENERAAPRTAVLVTIDTLRADYVSYAGHRRDTTPYLDRLAENGVVFRRAYAPSSLTAPSMASLFTGVYPTTHGIDSGLFAAMKRGAVQQRTVPAELVTLAESFQRAGYVTVGVPSNKNLAKVLGFGQGFDFYVDEAPFMGADRVNDRVRAQLSAAFGEDWRESWKRHRTFLWIHYFDPHLPYQAREPWIHGYAPGYAEDPDRYPAGLTAPILRQRYPDLSPEVVEKLAPLYASEVRYVDDQFRQLALELGLAEPGVAMIVTADHGEEFLEHGKLNHGKSLYEEVVSVPLFVHWPGGLFSSRELDFPVSLLDVYPTLLDWCGVEHPPGLQGESFARLLRGAPQDAGRLLVFEQRLVADQSRQIALLSGDWKLIRTRDSEEQVQLFNLRQDPAEQTDLAASEVARAQALDAALQGLLDQLPVASERSARWAEDAALGKELEDLGYAGD